MPDFGNLFGLTVWEIFSSGSASALEENASAAAELAIDPASNPQKPSQEERRQHSDRSFSREKQQSDDQEHNARARMLSSLRARQRGRSRERSR